MTEAAHPEHGRPGDILAFEAVVRRVLDEARRRGVRIVTAESCTGGMIAAALTAVSGSSDIVEGGLVTYANGAKIRLLGVSKTLLAAHGAVSEPVARAMAQGAVAQTGAELSIAVTGIAGPGGGSLEKPVGLVHFASSLAGADTVHRRMLFGAIGRAEVRAETVRIALQMLLERLA